MGLLTDMMGWFGWVRAGAPSPLRNLPAPDPWSAGDQTALRGYLFSGPGRKLVARLRAVEGANAVRACKNGGELIAVQAARAGGFSEALDYLLSLATPESISRTSRDKDETTTEETGDPSIRERLAP